MVYLPPELRRGQLDLTVSARYTPQEGPVARYGRLGLEDLDGVQGAALENPLDKYVIGGGPLERLNAGPTTLPSGARILASG